jgi:hypothetical protein
VPRGLLESVGDLQDFEIATMSSHDLETHG